MILAHPTAVYTCVCQFLLKIQYVAQVLNANHIFKKENKIHGNLPLKQVE